MPGISLNNLTAWNSAMPQHYPEATVSENSGVEEQKALRYAKKGIALALLSGFIFSLDGFFAGLSHSHSPFNDTRLFLLVPLLCAGIHDFCAALVTTSLNWKAGLTREVGRSMVSKPGRFVLAGAFIGAILGMGGYMAAIQMAGPAYVLPITSLYPAAGAVLAVLVLKEKVSLRAWAGLAMCVSGAILIGYTKPDGQNGDLFYLGLLFAALTALGWGIEGVLATSGMDFIEPTVALNIYYIVSTTLYFCLIIPLACVLLIPQGEILATLSRFLHSGGLIFVAGAGIMGSLAYRFWYKSMNMTGVSRAMALNITYAFWGIVLSFLFTDIHITMFLLTGSLVIFGGMFLVIGKPKDLLNLRNIQ